MDRDEIGSYASEKDKKSDSTNLNILEKADLYTKSFQNIIHCCVIGSMAFG
jgi:hypothetical protein